MRIAFVVNSRVRKNGKQNIRIRITDGRKIKEQKINTPINIFKEYWDKDEKRVSKKHPENDTINRTLKKYKDRKEYCINKFDAGEFSVRQVTNYMEGQSDYRFIDDYVLSIFKKRKTNVTFSDYLQKLNILKSHMGVKGKLRFKDINRNWFYDLLKKLQDKGLTKASIRSYSIAIGSILKDAYDEGVIQEIPKRPKEFRQGGKQDRKRKRKKIETSTTEQVEKVILDAETITQLQSVGFWLLAFCLRGFYPADIVKMEEAELDEPTLIKLLRNELYIEHLRSKSEHTENEHMYIHIDFKTTYRLIRRLKFITAYTHHNRQSYIADIDDELKIFDYNPTDVFRWHLDRWALHTRRLRPYGLSMLNARKTFLTKAKGLGIDQDTRLILVGRKNDPILARSYDDNTDPVIRNKVTEAHKLILKGFNVEKLVNMFIVKLQGFNAPIWVKKEASMFSWSKNLKEDNPIVPKFNFSPKYKWYFKGSARFGQSKHLYIPTGKELTKLASELDKLNKDKKKVVKLYPQLKQA
jgi:hypothetical protein